MKLWKHRFPIFWITGGISLLKSILFSLIVIGVTAVLVKIGIKLKV